MGCPHFIELCRRFLFSQVYDLGINPDRIDLDDCPMPETHVQVFTSASSVFYAPSELAGWSGMHRELIRCTDTWQGIYHRRDTVLVQMNNELVGFRGMLVGRVFSFFELTYDDIAYSCALIQWFGKEEVRDDVTGMWVVEPEFDNDGLPLFGVISLDSIVRACHLIPVYGKDFIPLDLDFSYTLDSFSSFYLNHYIDYHSHECLI